MNDLGCVLLGCAVSAAEVRERLTEALGLEPPCEPGTVATGASVRLMWLSPNVWLVLCSPERECDLVDAINECFPEKHVHATCYGDALRWFSLSGEEAQALLSEGAFVSLEPQGLPVGCAKRTLFAGIATIVIHEAPMSWTLGVERSQAHYLEGWLTRTRAVLRILP